MNTNYTLKNEFINDYLVITLKDDIKEFQLKMVNNNEMLGFLKIEIKNFNLDKSIYYNYSGLRKIKDLLFSGLIEEELIQKIFFEVIHKLIICEDYFLDNYSIILDLEYIFIDQVGNIRFIYVPGNNFENEDIGLDQLKKNIIRIYKNLSGFVNTKSIFKDKRIISYLKNLDFDNVLLLLNKESNLIKPNNSQINKYFDENNFNTIRVEETTENYNRSKNLSILLGVIVQIIIIVIFIQINRQKSIPIIEGNFTYSFILILIICLILSAILWEFILNKKRRNNFNQALLLGNNQRLKIEKDEFHIGSEKEFVDLYIDDDDIDNLHAKIIFVDGNYFILDLNSESGTYINGIRIERNKKFEILNNDKISFAYCDYIFITGDNIE